MAVTPADCLRRKRKEAVAKGLCIVCTERQPPLGRSTCTICSAAAAERVVRWRKRQSELRELKRTARTEEDAGDLAFSHFSYVDAADRYETALANIRKQPQSDSNAENEARVTEKLGLAIFYGSRPDLASVYFQRAIVLCTTVPSLRNRLPAALQRLPRQKWLESRTIEALGCCDQARSIALDLHDEDGVRNADVSAASWLVSLGRYDEARQYVTLDEQEDSEPAVRADHVLQRAIILATQGRAPSAFAEFDRAVEIARLCLDGYLTTVVWDDYANWATALGRLDVARPCRERALFVARERRVAWRIPYLTLRLAGTLVMSGETEAARDLLHDALTYDIDTPVLRVLASTVGMDLAIALEDRQLLGRMMRDDVLEVAFSSEEPGRIAPLVAAFARVYIAEGRLQKARALIHRACSIVHQADHAGELLALAAQYGYSEDAIHARAVLAKRKSMAHSGVAQADLALWEAYAARRRRSAVEAREFALRAARLFSRLGRRNRRAEALAISGAQRMRVDQTPPQLLASHLSPSLTKREREVADLVLRGLTNRVIAQQLAIAEHTVETHVTSILNRLGLRSRWQLVDRAHN